MERFFANANHSHLAMVFGGAGIGFLIYGLWGSTMPSRPATAPAIVITAPEEKKMSVIVDVNGAVAKPGVYQITHTARVNDALLAAGGVLSEADKQYLAQKMNLAAKVEDGMKIYVPFQSETVAESSVGKQLALIALNTAASTELESLPGIGEVTAKKIIAGRPYTKVTDLVEKKIISQTAFEKIKEQVSVF